jgi:hypothetical protein
MVTTPRSALPALAAVLLAVCAAAAPRAQGTPAAQHTVGQPVSRASAAAGVVPIFKAYIVGETVPHKRKLLRLTRIGVLLARRMRDAVLTVDCLGCHGGGGLGALRRRGREDFFLPHLLVTGQSRLLVDVRRPGWIGRFKVYTLQPRLRAHRLIQQGCLAVDAYAAAYCTASSRTEYVGPGTLFAPSCPGYCLAVTRVTGYQETTVGLANVSSVREAGYLTAWQVALGRPTPQQISFFDTNEGGPAEAGVAVLQPEPSPSFTYRLLEQSPLVKLQQSFGVAVQFDLAQPLKVEAGDLIALTVPTWAPVLALGFSNQEATWRSSRQAGQCTTTSTQASDTQAGSLVQYSCGYAAAQLAYDAVIDPSP